MNKKQYINKLSFLFFFLIFVFFSCNNEKEVEKEVLSPAFELKIDSLNASEFAKSFVEDIYRSDSSSTYSKIEITLQEGLLLNEKIFSKLDLFTELSKQVLTGGDLSFVGVQIEGSEFSILLRILNPAIEVNYYQIYLKDKNNSIVISDYYSFSNGEKASSIALELINITDGNLSKNEIEVNLIFLDSIYEAFNQFNTSKATTFYHKLTPFFINSLYYKAVKFEMEFHSGTQVGEVALLKRMQLEDKRKSSYWLYNFYFEYSLKNYGRARIALTNLSENVLGDPILIYLEATTYFEEYNYTKALDLYNEALTKEPTIPNIHFAKVICLIEMGEYIQAVESLLVMEDYFDVENTNWDKEFMAYPEFLMSDEYSRWLERIDSSETEPA